MQEGLVSGEGGQRVLLPRKDEEDIFSSKESFQSFI